MNRTTAFVRMILMGAVLLGPLAVASAQAQDVLLRRMIQNGWIRYGISGGRVSLGGTRLGNISSSRSLQPGEESINLHNENGQLDLNYKRTNSEETIEITISNDRVAIHRTPRGNSSALAVHFSQTPSEPLKLTVGSGAEQQEFHARGLWQLLLAQPQPCRQHLLPLLETLRPDWKLTDTMAAVEKKLLQEAEAGGPAGRARWATLVAQLADDSFTKREAADRALRTGGAGAIAYLRQLDFSRLDAEQQLRVRRIIESQTVQNGDDSVEQIAALLAGDPSVWLALLTRPESTTRQTAARQLAALLGEPTAVDPAADPDTQKDQREQLRSRIEQK